MERDIAVCLTFDFDAISMWMRGERDPSPTEVSRGEFGRLAAERIVDSLARLDVPATWFIPGHTVDTFPETVDKIAAAGHEIGHHGYNHENPRSLDRAREEEILGMGIASIERATGKRPRGYRSPSWDVSPNTIELLLANGFRYDSSLMGTDFAPYYARVGDVPDRSGPHKFGEATTLVELPVDWSMDDWPYFGLNWRAQHIGLRDPQDVYNIWSAEFDYLYERVGSGVFILTMHPQVIGRAHRLLMVERLIESFAGRQGVRFETMSAVAEHWAATNPG